MKTTFARILSIFLFIAFLYPALGSEIHKDYHQSYRVSEGSTLHLTFGDGDVSVIPWDKDVLDITVKYHAKIKSLGVGKKQDFEVEFRERGKDIYVTGHEDHSIALGIFSSRTYQYHYTIRAPRYLRLDLRGEDGDVEIEDWAGEIECRTDDGDFFLRHGSCPSVNIRMADGDVSIEEWQGELEIRGDDGDVFLENCKIHLGTIKLEDGNITIRDCRGNFKIVTEDGNVKTFRTHARQLDIRTEDGRVDLNLLKSHKLDLTIGTMDGNVMVTLEAGISASFAIDTNDGRIRTDLSGATRVRKGPHSVSGKLYGGEGQIHISTRDGNVTLRELR